MVDSPVFDLTCDELQRQTGFDRMATRGTVRLALKSAGLEVTGVDLHQMGVVLRKVLPPELEARGVADGRAVCDAIAEALAGAKLDVGPDRADRAASTVARFGS